jgi:hypothetical protein
MGSRGVLGVGSCVNDAYLIDYRTAQWCAARGRRRLLPGRSAAGMKSGGNVNEEFERIVVRAYLMDRPGSMRLSTVADPICGSDEILVATEAVSVCSTDISYFRGHLFRTRGRSFQVTSMLAKLSRSVRHWPARSASANG